MIALIWRIEIYLESNFRCFKDLWQNKSDISNICFEEIFENKGNSILAIFKKCSRKLC